MVASVGLRHRFAPFRKDVSDGEICMQCKFSRASYRCFSHRQLHCRPSSRRGRTRSRCQGPGVFVASLLHVVGHSWVVWAASGQSESDQRWAAGGYDGLNGATSLFPWLHSTESLMHLRCASRWSNDSNLGLADHRTRHSLLPVLLNSWRMKSLHIPTLACTSANAFLFAMLRLREYIALAG